MVDAARPHKQNAVSSASILSFCRLRDNTAAAAAAAA